VNGRAYYEPSSHGMEARFSERARLIREILHPEKDGGPGGGADGAETGASEPGSGEKK